MRLEEKQMTPSEEMFSLGIWGIAFPRAREVSEQGMGQPADSDCNSFSVCYPLPEIFSGQEVGFVL